ncbi:accessory gland protein Acp63F [Drosophila takahashii]|uniref:accessory gland protein Acp63F n=1 Tax=Drosophila takahashii TaxID=29030 RepID=UPI001CF8DC28|nr:accessory gland protein Acp63F [Drosophila takahashii]
MKNFSILFVLVILILEIKGECSSTIPPYLHPLCGFASECVFEAGNEVDIKNESCRRREQGKAPFLAVRNGSCPTNLKQCSRAVAQ